MFDTRCTAWWQAIKEEYEVVVCDTSGRLHTNASLMEELAKCKRAIGKRLANAPHETLLVLDGTTGDLYVIACCVGYSVLCNLLQEGAAPLVSFWRMVRELKVSNLCLTTAVFVLLLPRPHLQLSGISRVLMYSIW
jgi:hypothetical protein